MGKMQRYLAMASIVGLIAGCESIGLDPNAMGSKETAGTGVGAVMGGLLGGIVGDKVGGKGGAIVGAALGIAGGALLGGKIGRNLDEEDRERAAEATLAALENAKTAPVPSPSAPAVVTSPPKASEPASEQVATASKSTSSASEAAPTDAQPIVVETAPVAKWESSDKADVKGAAQVVDARIDDGRECRTVSEVAYIRGSEVKQSTEYCRSSTGGWVLETA